MQSFPNKELKIRSLKDTPFEEIMECFFLAFQNYPVEMSNDRGYFEERWRMANVDYGLSFGVFHQAILVGFVLNAIGNRDGLKTAYNACTGVLPGYRGKNMVKSIYDHAIPLLKANGIERCTLEVIDQNIRAVKAYKKVGFEITKHYTCFRGSLAPNPVQGYELRKGILSTEVLVGHRNQGMYSWENHAFTITRGDFKYFEIVANDSVESYFVIKPESGYVAQLEVLTHQPDAWVRLFAGMAQISHQIKINNVDDRLKDKITRLHEAGLENHVNQFEMEMRL